MASQARQYAARNRQGSDWFSHDATAQPSPVKSSAPTASTNPILPSPQVNKTDDSSTPAANAGDAEAGRTKMIKPTCDSNQWYKYDAATQPAKPQPTASVEERSAEKPLEKPAEKLEEKPAEKLEPKSEAAQVVRSDAEVYSQRGKSGTSSDWFRHDHPKGSASDTVHQHGSSKEIGANAARMRGESEHWFSHEHAAGEQATSPVHTSKARANRPGTNEMHDIFHHGAVNN